jgi:predicted enzyme related to lactoylglutathione lyase
MGRVVHFEFFTPDQAKEKEFFKTLFGWRSASGATTTTGWWTPAGAPGINGAIMPSAMPDQPRLVNTVDVPDLVASIANATAAGATTAMAKQEVPNMGWTANMLSPTGILFGMIQARPGGMM